MILNFSRMVGVAAALFVAGSASAQEESENRVAANTDWSVFVESDPNECWAVSAPKETLNTRDGTAVDVRRGDIRLIVFYRPSEDVNGQVMFTGGYPFADGSTVSVQVGDTTFQMFTQGETAWPATPDDDAKFVAAMKRGANAVLTARSGRGTQTQDTFSLLGFTAAVDEAANRCSG
ncbi:invasion associated locus B family protein [Loktanella sp. Alg231-35]|uniref:invasion associated locus B family protein n=1 Tax=Loktanella sp. Alg231-35 TaxID=1922220 RepID=UPI0019026B90|nr:invasion associated locus B family protein [Loktanella sp. Alg231-35]